MNSYCHIPHGHSYSCGGHRHMTATGQQSSCRDRGHYSPQDRYGAALIYFGSNSFSKKLFFFIKRVFRFNNFFFEDLFNKNKSLILSQ